MGKRKSSSHDTSRSHPYLRDLFEQDLQRSQIIRTGHLGEGVFKHVRIIQNGKVTYQCSL